MTVIEIRSHRNGWKVFEAPGVEPVFLQKDQAINYAENRASFRSGEIRILDSTGNVERTISVHRSGQKTVNAHLSASGYVVAVCGYLERGSIEHLASGTEKPSTRVMAAPNRPGSGQRITSPGGSPALLQIPV